MATPKHANLFKKGGRTVKEREETKTRTQVLDPTGADITPGTSIVLPVVKPKPTPTPRRRKKKRKPGPDVEPVGKKNDIPVIDDVIPTPKPKEIPKKTAEIKPKTLTIGAGGGKFLEETYNILFRNR